jgi:hypothetical protein
MPADQSLRYALWECDGLALALIAAKATPQQAAAAWACIRSSGGWPQPQTACITCATAVADPSASAACMRTLSCVVQQHATAVNGSSPIQQRLQKCCDSQGDGWLQPAVCERIGAVAARIKSEPIYGDYVDNCINLPSAVARTQCVDCMAKLQQGFNLAAAYACVERERERESCAQAGHWGWVPGVWVEERGGG